MNNLTLSIVKSAGSTSVLIRAPEETFQVKENLEKFIKTHSFLTTIRTTILYTVFMIHLLLECNKTTSYFI